VFLGKRDRKGYGKIGEGGTRVHRLMWSWWNGREIPVGMWVLHHCDNPPCWRPDHLFLGDNQANQQDSSAKGRTRNGNYYKTHCPAGHAYEETDYGYANGRVCRICKRETARRWYHEHGGSIGRRARAEASSISGGSDGVSPIA